MTNEIRQQIAQNMLESNWAEAASLLLQVLDAEPNDIEALGTLAEVYRYEGSFNESLSMFQKAISIAESFDSPTADLGLAISLGNLYENIALSNFALGNNEIALEQIDKSIVLQNPSEYTMARAVSIEYKVNGLETALGRAASCFSRIKEIPEFQRTYDLNREVARPCLLEIMDNASPAGDGNIPIPVESFDLLDNLRRNCFNAISNIRSIPEEAQVENDAELMELAADFLRQICIAYYIGNGTSSNPSYYKSDYSEASKGFECWQLAAEIGNDNAYHFLGMSYYTGSGTAQDYSRAVEWLSKAVELHPDDSGNCAMLANCLFHGLGTEKNPTKAFELVQKPAAENNALAQLLLGEMFETGEGTDQDVEKALMWYQRSFASDGDERAQVATNRVRYKIQFGNSDYEAKIELLDAFAQEAIHNKESVKYDLNRMRTFLADYMKIAQVTSPTTVVRLAFIQSLLGTPDFVFKEANFVTADYFNSEFDKAVNDENIDGKGLAISTANSLLYGKALSECVDNFNIGLAEANWTSIANHVDDVARKFGWNGHYDDEPQIAMEKQNSELFKMLHNSGNMLPQTGSREDNAVLLGVLIASQIEGFLQRAEGFTGKNELLALSGLLNSDYESKNQQFIREFDEDLSKICDAAVPGLVEYRERHPDDIEILMIMAFVISVQSGFRPDALVYLTFLDMLSLEKEGVPTDEVSLCFGILGYLVEFESWHNLAYGGALPTDHSNDQSNGTQQNHQQTQSSQQGQVKSGGCYVATSVYGSYDCPEVWVLRRFRDRTLKNNYFGRSFVSVYYLLSPSLVKLFGQKKWFNRFWKRKLDKLVELLRTKGFSDAKYKD